MKRLLLILLLLTMPLYATDYYVKNGGNDGADGQSDGNAWATIDKVRDEMGTYNPGDSIYFKRGSIFTDKVLNISCSGTSGNVITFGAYGTGSKPIIDAEDTRDYCIVSTSGEDYVTVEDLDCRNSVTNAILFATAASTNITISRCNVANAGNVGILFDEIDTLIIEDCTVTNSGNGGIGITGSASNAATNTIIRDNTVNGDYTANGTQNDGIVYHVDGSGNGCGASHLVDGNTCYDHEEQGIDIYGASNVIVSNNECYGNNLGAITIGHPDDIVARIYLEDNYFHDDDYIVNAGLGQNYVLIRNVFHSPDSYGCFAGNFTNIRLYHNVFLIDASGVTSQFMFETGGDYFYLKNNIFTSTNSNTARIYNYYAGTTATSTNTTSDYNCFYYSAGLGSPFYDSTEGTMTLAAWTTAYSQDGNSQSTDPLLISPPGNCAVNTGSPCINNGTWITTITTANGSGTAFAVGDAEPFHDGFGVATGQSIQLEGDTSSVTVTDVNYSTKTITVNSSVSWTQGDGVAFEFNGAAPDIGAVEYDAGSSGEHKAILKSGVKTILKSGVKWIIK